MIEQRSLEWFEARRGLITCSRLADVIANSNAYLRDLKLERDGQQIDRDVDAAALNWGKETEPKAIAAYEFANDCDVEPAEFRVSTDREYLAGSADGLVNTSGMIEVKCPFDEGIHTLTLLNGMPERTCRRFKVTCTSTIGSGAISFPSIHASRPSVGYSCSASSVTINTSLGCLSASICSGVACWISKPCRIPWTRTPSRSFFNRRQRNENID